MRIISGFHKGRKLHSPPQNSKSIRPTSDKAREALFNILACQVANSRVLDLFAGTGAVGLEAYSRGAQVVVFIENDHTAMQILRKNVEALSPANHNTEGKRLQLIKHDLHKPLPTARLLASGTSSFDIIFADPPYDSKLSHLILESIAQSNLLATDGIVIIEERKSAALPVQVGNLALADNRQYGENGFWLYRQS